jgi:hypothetical protein
MDQPGALDHDVLCDRVGGHNGLGGTRSGLGRQCGVRLVHAGQQVVAVVGQTDQAGRADHDVDGADTDELGNLLGDRVRGLETVGAGVAVGAAGVEDDSLDGAVLDGLLTPEHGVGLASVGGEDAGGVEGGAAVDDQGQVQRGLGVLGRLQPGGDAGGGESAGVGDAHFFGFVFPGGLDFLGGLDRFGSGDGVPLSSPRLGRQLLVDERTMIQSVSKVESV